MKVCVSQTIGSSVSGIPLLLVLFVASSCAQNPKTQLAFPLAGKSPVTRVACVGDSITFGARVEDRVNNNYPTQLGNLLGKAYDVRNFGVSGSTLLQAGNKPYRATPAFGKALEFRANIVLIKLGTNDSKLQNWSQKADFATDCKDLIAEFRKQTNSPRIMLLLPVPAWSTGDKINGDRIKNEVIPLIREVAFNTDCEIVDLHTAFQEQRDWMSPDGIHPNSAGAGAIANVMREIIMTPRDDGYDFKALLDDEEIAYELSSFHGYPLYEFKHKGRACKIVAPRKAAEGRPWIWRARFFGHQPQTDLALLERGFHVTYTDVANLFGARQAVMIWDEFYSFLHKEMNLHATPVLEGMSRGGLIVYNWAARNPDKVAGIYADAPVCDIRSWPGGKGNGKGSAKTWIRCMEVYELDEENAKTFKKNPIDNLKPLAKAKIPLLSVVGQADTVVPVAENTDIVESRYKALGGEIEVIRKPGVDHHPHSLVNPRRIVDFALKSLHKESKR